MLRILKNISVYSLGSILATGVSFFLLPLYTRILQPADYGQLELVYLVASILVILFGLKIELGYGRIYFLKNDADYRKTLFATGQAFNLFCSILFIVILFLNIDWFAAHILKFEGGSYFLKLISLATVFEVLLYIPLNNLRVRYMAKQYITSSLLKLILTISFTIYFIAFLDLGVAGVLYGKILGTFITLMYAYYLTWNEFVFKFSLKQLWPMLGFSIFLIPANLSSLILNMSNRYFLQEYQNLNDVGLYSLGAKIASVIPLLFTGPVKQAFSPYVMELADQPEKCKNLLSDFIRYFFAGLSVFVLAISIFANDLISIMADKSFEGSGNIVFILAFSNLILGVAALVVLAIHITRKTWIVTIIWVVSSIFNIFLNIWLIPLYSRTGAAYATLFSILFICVMYIFAAQRVFPLKIPYLAMIKVLVVLILFNYIGSLITLSILLNVFLKLFLVCCYSIILMFFLGVFSKIELHRFKSFLFKKLQIK